MRWFVVLLLTANLILFFWVQQQSKPAPGSVGLPPPDIGQLRLSHETDERQAAVAVAAVSLPEDPAAETQEPAIEPAGVLEAAPSTIAAGNAIAEPGPAPAPPDSGPQTPANETAEPEQAAAVSTAVSASPRALAVTPQPDEPPVIGPLPAVPAGPTTDAQADLAGPACIRVGPLVHEDADKLIAGLPQRLQLLSDTSAEFARVDGYFVLIPPLSSSSAAQQVLEELAAVGIRDTWLFRGGDLRNAISLGVYSNEAGAQRHAERIRSKGFASAEVREKTSPEERRWLMLKTDDGDDPADGLSLPKDATATPLACP